MNEQHNNSINDSTTGETQTTIIIGSKFIMNQTYKPKQNK